MDERVDNARKLIDISINKAIEAANRKREKRALREKSNDGKERKISAFKIVCDVYCYHYREKYDRSPPIWGMKEFGQCKKLILKVGEDESEKLIRYVFKNWEWISKEINLTGAPLIGDILARCIRYAEKALEFKKESGERRVARL